MPSRAAAGFWSYAHDDDEMDDGAVLKLADLIGKEFNMMSPLEPLELFVDRHSLAWGEKWRQRIDSALSETTFFIPIITPRYFTRPECRKELLEFAGKAQSLGVVELILPILYMETEDLSAESPEETVALIARTQYIDWRSIRFLEPASREYRKAVHDLASRLLEISKEVAERQISRELRAEPEDDGLGGIIDIVEEINKLMPAWLEAVKGDKINSIQIEATLKEFDTDILRLKRSNAQPSAMTAVHLRMGKEVLPLLQRFHKEATTYSTLSIQLDPLISGLSRLISEHPDSYALVTQIRDAIDEAMEAIRADDEAGACAQGSISLPEKFASMRHIGRIFQKCSATFQDAIKLVDEGNSIVRRWDLELSKQP